MNPHVLMNQLQINTYNLRPTIYHPQPLPEIFETNHKYIVSFIHISLLPQLKSFKIIHFPFFKTVCLNKEPHTDYIYCNFLLILLIYKGPLLVLSTIPLFLPPLLCWGNCLWFCKVSHSLTFADCIPEV